MGTSIGERLKQFHESGAEHETVSVCLALDGPMGSNSWRQGRIEWIAEDTVCFLDTDGKRESVFSLGSVVSYSITRKETPAPSLAPTISKGDIRRAVESFCDSRGITDVHTPTFMVGYLYAKQGICTAALAEAANEAITD